MEIYAIVEKLLINPGGIMKSSEVWVLVALACFVAGALFTGFKEMPSIESQEIDNAPRELSIYDQLKSDIQSYHFGNVPRESFSGDTTIWTTDLDYNLFSMHQVNLQVTRILRNHNFSDIFVRERSSGGLVFSGVFPDGQLLQIHFTSP